VQITLPHARGALAKEDLDALIELMDTTLIAVDMLQTAAEEHDVQDSAAPSLASSFATAAASLALSTGLSLYTGQSAARRAPATAAAVVVRAGTAEIVLSESSEHPSTRADAHAYTVACRDVEVFAAAGYGGAGRTHLYVSAQDARMSDRAPDRAAVPIIFRTPWRAPVWD
jgi:hypothetical protein